MWFVCDGDLLFFVPLPFFLTLCLSQSIDVEDIIRSASLGYCICLRTHTHTHTPYISLLPPILLRYGITQQLGHFLSFFHPQEGRKKTDLLARPCRCVFSAAVQGKAFSLSSTISLFVVTFTGNLNTIQLNFVFGAKFN